MSLRSSAIRPVLAAATAVVAGTAATLLALSAPAVAASGCSVGYTKTSEWQGGFGASVSITNLGDAISGWTLEWSFADGQQVGQHWNATITQAGTQVTAKNVTYNAAIPTGGTAEFGFNGTFSAANPVPSSFRLNGVACTGGVDTPAPTTTTPTTPGTPTTTTTPNQPSTFTNPVVWQDFADGDIIRVGDTYYYSASTMHYSPGAPILRSYDLVNWEYAGHSVPKLDFGAKYDLNGGRGYVRGIWASFLNHRASNNTFYWGGCIDFAKTYIYTATAVDGPWSRHTTIDKCYYDAGMLIDDNDTMYVAYGNTTLSVAQLSPDGKTEVRSQQVFQTPSNIGTLEGSRFYKRNGSYYIFATRPANGQYILKASNPFGPYTVQQVLLDLPGPIQGGGVPHQGGMVQTQNGDWYYMAFVDAYPGGRVPVLAPITWTADGWPRLQTVNGRWGVTYPKPNLPPPPRQVEPMIGTDTFQGTALKPQWEWNHNPDTTKFSVGNGLKLATATVTNDLYSARNTLTRRIQGPTSTATATLDLTSMRDGDRTGLAMLRDSSAWIGVKRDGGRNRVVMVTGLTMDGNWNTTGTGTEVAAADLPGTKIWLRANADIRPGTGRQAKFSYSTDGTTFTPLGSAFTLNNAWQFFMGYRFAVFNYASQSLGGAVTLQRFDLTTP
ncbi:family 43 glycosylhydrolase [Amycolatopsis sp. NPDC049688]|uniref:family 43 glycosylhydrolase n=1 Tax=Amycolatopsis sp. NPDC049688 TaxID=3154733 RepID=UPI00344AC150